MYQITGTINSLLMFATVWGLYHQLVIVWHRKKDPQISHPTDLLSTNQFFTSFLAFFSLFFHGFMLTPFNHFIVWPRIIASFFVLALLWEIYRDRANSSSRYCFYTSLTMLILGFGGLLLSTLLDYQLPSLGKSFSSTLIVIVTLILAQGYYHQIMVIIRNKHTGAVALKLSQSIAIKDISTIAFALTMPLDDSWPLIFLATVSLITKLIIMYLFKYVRQFTTVDDVGNEQPLQKTGHPF